MGETGTKPSRKYYLDNLRHIIVILVVIYHVIYIFNSVGVVSNIAETGIPQMDIFLYFVYPWFMCALFLIAGIGARYALQKRTAKEFAKNRARRLLVPSIAGIFVFGWIAGLVTAQYNDIFAGNGDAIPGIAKYFIYSSIGTGPLWFAQELFLTSMILLLIRAIDKKDKLWELGGKANFIAILLMFFAVWGSAQILNTPVLVMYRHGIYIYLFLLGYYVFSHDNVQNILEKYCIPLLIVALTMGIAYTIYYYGTNYSSDECLKSVFTNAYAWIMILAVLGCDKRWLNKNYKFTKYMASRSFGIYVLHYPVLILFAYLVMKYLSLPMILNYILLVLIEIIVVPLFYEVICRIPIISPLVLGKPHKGKNKS